MIPLTVLPIQPENSARSKDPVCGMMVDPAHAKGTALHEGQTYYFCAVSCMNKFKQAPASYLAPGEIKIPTTKIEATEWICPMDPEVLQDHPGSCP